MEGFFLWQTIGAGLMTAAPALTFSLKKLADEGRLGEAWAKTLNAGLLAAAAGHLAGVGVGVWGVARQGEGLLRLARPHRRLLVCPLPPKQCWDRW